MQELEPNKLALSLKCYPEASVIQKDLLNELEEQYVSAEEMSELYKDVEELMNQFDGANSVSIMEQSRKNTSLILYTSPSRVAYSSTSETRRKPVRAVWQRRKETFDG